MSVYHFNLVDKLRETFIGKTQEEVEKQRAFVSTELALYVLIMYKYVHVHVYTHVPTVGVIIKFPFRFCYRSVFWWCYRFCYHLSPFTTVPFFSGVTVFVTVSHRLQPFRFTVQRELVSAELEGI